MGPPKNEIGCYAQNLKGGSPTMRIVNVWRGKKRFFFFGVNFCDTNRGLHRVVPPLVLFPEFISLDLEQKKKRYAFSHIHIPLLSIKSTPKRQ